MEESCIYCVPIVSTALVVGILYTVIYLNTHFLSNDNVNENLPENGLNKKDIIDFLKNSAILMVALLIFYTVFSLVITDSSKEDLGALGNFFSGIFNPLIGLASVAILFLTYLQMKTELETTQGSIKIQNFDSKFFKILELFNNVQNNLKSELKNEFDDSQNNIFFHWLIEEKINISSSSELNKFSIEFKNKTQFLNQYFSIQKELIEFIIRESNLTNNDKKTYLNIFKSILDQHEAILFLLNSYRLSANSNYKKLIEEYSILDFISNETFYDYKKLFAQSNTKKNIILGFEKEAFGENKEILKYYEKVQNSN